jgi:ArsR family transcriptional regulator, arsenate/arsenite/antimonite-responsive transcriptional repressor
MRAGRSVTLPATAGRRMTATRPRRCCLGRDDELRRDAARGLLRAAGRGRDPRAEARATAEVFKALGDPHRVRIVSLLAASDDAVCVCDLTPALGISQPTVSHHLKKLLTAGLIVREQRGTWSYYSLDREAIERLAVIADLTEVAR